MKHLNHYIFEALGGEVNGFCILKPEFLEHQDNFCSLLTNNNWKIIQKEVRTFSPEEAQELYISKKDETYYDDLCKYMSSGDSLSCMCYKDCEDPIKDMNTIKDKVRKAWGKDEMKNAMHSSDSLENVDREYKLIFVNRNI